MADNTRRQEITVTTSTMVRAVLVVVVTFAAIGIIDRLSQPIVWVVVAAFLAIGLEPLIRRVARVLGGRRVPAILLVTLALVAIFVLVMSRLIPPLIDQTQSLLSNFPEIQAKVSHSDNFAARLVDQYDLLETLNNNKEKIVAFITGSFGSIFAGSINLIGATVTIFVLLIYFVSGGPGWIETIKQSRWGPGYRTHEKTLQTMAAAISSYVVGNAITSALAFTAAFTMLVLLGIGFPFPLAFLYGIFDIIPLIGATLGGILLVAVALFKSWTAAIIMLIFILVYQQFESSFLQPRVYGKALQLPGVIVMLAAIAGGALAGLVGALLAIPAAACIRVGVLAYLNRKPPKSA